VSITDVRLLTGLPYPLIVSFFSGEVKPNEVDREILTRAGQLFYKDTPFFYATVMNRVRYRLARHFISVEENADLLKQPNDAAYNSVLQILVARHRAEIETYLDSRCAKMRAEISGTPEQDK
jgi:hypothetical protein